MSVAIGRNLIVPVLFTVLLVPITAATGQTARNRTLRYNVDQKEWVEDAPPTPGTPEAEMHALRLLVTNKNYRQALAETKRLIRKLGENHQFYPDLLIARAEIQIGRKRLAKAHATLQEFLSKFGGTALTAKALRLEFIIAESYLKGEKRRWLGIPLLSGENEAVTILDQISTDYPDSQLTELAIKVTADHMFDAGEHSLAEGEYARLLREYPRGRYTEYAMGRSADAALASYGGVEYDEGQLIEAEERFADFSRFSPAAAESKGIPAILDSIRESRAEKDFSIAAYYDRTEHFSSAIYYYRSIVQNWPGAIASIKAAERLRLLGATETGVRTGGGGP